MLSFQQALFGLILPVLLAGLCWAAWMFLAGREGWQRHIGGIASAFAVPVAFGAAFWAVESRGAFPPVDSVHWLFYCAGAVAVIAALEALIRPAWLWAKPVFWLPALFLIFYLVSTNWRRYPGDEPDTFRLTGVQVAGALAAWTAGGFALRAAVGRVGCASPASAAWVLGLTSAFAAAVIEMEGSHFVGTFRMASTGLALLPLLVLLLTLRRSGEMPAATLTTWTVLFSGALLASYLYYSKFDALHAVLLAAAPTLAAAIPSNRRGWKGAAARVAVVIIPLVVAFVLALIPFLKSMSEDNAGY